jgi:DNA repair exonuclease SbcCD ATPase subunit
MSESDDLTVHILRELRAELRSTSQRLDQHIDSTNRRFDSVDQRFERLERAHADLASRVATRDQIVELDLRMATRMVEHTAATRDLYDLLNANLQLRDRVERCEHDIAELKDRSV